jgi:DNA primase
MSLDYKVVFANILTGNEKRIGNNLMVCCPFHNDKTPSFGISLNPDKQVYKCFGCTAKGSFIGYYMQINSLTYHEAIEKLNIKNIPIYSKTQQSKKESKYMDFSKECFNALDFFANDNHWQYNCQKLYEMVGITASVALWRIGLLHSNWLFPIIKYPECQYVGYELRPYDFTKFQNGRKCKKVTLEKGYILNCLSVIYPQNGVFNYNKCIICEGFKDGYFMLQYLQQKYNSLDIQETILTPSCGVATLPELLKQYDLQEFKEVVFVLDNDKAGNEIKEQIKALRKNNYKFFNGLKENEDFTDWYKNKKEN